MSTSTTAPAHVRESTQKAQRQAICSAVVGLQWGDEGKGKVIDVITPRFSAVARYNGGANAGHSVVFAGKRHALHLIPSGIFHRGVKAVIGNGVVVDPQALLTEIEKLTQAGADLSQLCISDRAHVVMPYHQTEDALRENILAAQTSVEGETEPASTLAALHGPGKSIGTTKRGIGPAYSDKANRSTSIRMGDLLRPAVLREKIEQTVRFKNAMMAVLAPDAPRLSPDALYHDALNAGERLRPYITDTVYLLHDLLAANKPILFEGANATLLDVDHGTYPYVTSSSCSVLGIPSGTGVPGANLGEVIGVLKAYSTRVGGGPFPTELLDTRGDRIRERGREYGTTTGRPRRCGWLDLVAVRYSAMINGCTSLAVMLLDVLAGFDELRVCTSYELDDGKVTDRFMPDASSLTRVKPRYEVLAGFSEEITSCKTRASLPATAQKYLSFIEKFVGVPIGLVSVGPDREQTIRE